MPCPAPDQDSGVASSLLDTAWQVGGATGLALLGTVAWTAVADSVRTQVARAAAAAAAGGLGQSNTAKGGRPSPKPGTPVPASIYDHALTVGFPRGFGVAAGIGLLALVTGIVTIRVSRQDLAGPGPGPQEAAPPAASQPLASQPLASQPAASQPPASQVAAPRVAARRVAARRVAARQPGSVQLHEDRAVLAAAVRPCRFC